MAIPTVIPRSRLIRHAHVVTVRDSRRDAPLPSGMIPARRPRSRHLEQSSPARLQQPFDDLEHATWEDAEWQ
jgi:hypothetical protein